MEVSSQFHVQDALPPEEEPSVPVGYEVGWAPEWRVKNITSAGSTTLAVQRVDRRYTGSRFIRYRTVDPYSEGTRFESPSILVGVSRGFPNHLKGNAGIVTRLGRDRLYPNSFRFIDHPII
jgi:hypothetical protein